MAFRVLHILVGIGLTLCAGDAVAHAQDAPNAKSAGAARRSRTPYCTSAVRFPAPIAPETKSGQPTPEAVETRVQLRYRAVPLSPDTLASVVENARARAFYNGRVFRRLIQLHTDLPLQIGDKRLERGNYDAGLQCEGVGKWQFVVVDRAGQTIASAALLLTSAETPIPCLNLSLIPISENALAIAVRYGTRRGTILAKVVAANS